MNDGGGNDERGRESSGLPAYRELLSAFAALTAVVPRSWSRAATPGVAALFYPVVGLILGAAMVGLDSIAFAVPHVLRAALVVGGLTALTAGETARGFARFLCVLPHAADRERAVAELESGASTFPRRMTFALALAVKIWAVYSMARYRLWGLLLAPMLSRWSMVVSAFSARAARPRGTGKRYMPDLAFREFAWASVFTFAVVLSAMEAFGIFVVVMIAAITVGLRLIWHAWVGGVNSALVGATAELTELAALFVFSIF